MRGLLHETLQDHEHSPNWYTGAHVHVAALKSFVWLISEVLVPWKQLRHGWHTLLNQGLHSLECTWGMPLAESFKGLSSRPQWSETRHSPPTNLVYALHGPLEGFRLLVLSALHDGNLLHESARGSLRLLVFGRVSRPAPAAVSHRDS